MNRKVKASLFTVILLCGLLLASVALATAMYVDTSNGKTLNVRDYPSLDGNVIARLDNGSRVEVDDRSIVGGWGRVYAGNVKGYCMMRYLSRSKPGPSPTLTPTSMPGVDMFANFTPCYYAAAVRPSSPGGFVHMRWAPSKVQPIQTDFYNGDVLLVIAQNGEWSQVYDEQTHVGGFMMTAYLESVYYPAT